MQFVIAILFLIGIEIWYRFGLEVRLEKRLARAVVENDRKTMRRVRRQLGVK